MKAMKTSTKRAAATRPVLQFEDWIAGLDAKTYDAEVDAKLAELESVELGFEFPRLPVPASGRRGGARAFREEVGRIPVMDRAEEQGFAMGIELLFELTMASG